MIKTQVLYFMLFIVLITACAPQSVVPPPVLTKKTSPTTPPIPTLTPEPTPVSIPMVEIPLDACARIMEVETSDTDVLEIIYTELGEIPSLSKFGYYEWHTGLWLWSDATQTAVPFPLPQNVFAPKLSTDHRHIIFRRDSGVDQSELWVIDADGQNERRLATLSYDDVQARNIDFPYASLEYDWVPSADKIFYGVSLTNEADYVIPIYDSYTVVDINSGKAITLKISPEFEKIEFAPDGSQVALQMANELRVLSTQTGKELFTIPVSLNDLIYSPDGKYIIDFIDGGILRIDAFDGQQQIIPLKYTVMHSRTEGPALSDPLPDFKWTGDATFILSSLNSDARFVLSFAEPNPDWTFTIWQVDLADATTDPIQTFNGHLYAADFSPDMKRLAFWKYEGTLPDQTRDLMIADISTGEILATVAGGVFKMWFPDSTRYLYETGSPYPPPGKGDPGASEIVIKRYLGQVGRESILADWNASGFGRSEKWWVDKNRLVADCKIVHFP